MEKSKVCFRCGIMKPIPEYYKHPQMGDGHLNKCKTCTKSDSSLTEAKIRSTPEGVESERLRHREKYHRLGYKEKQTIWNNDKEFEHTSIIKNLKKNVLKKYPNLKDTELHHWNYNYQYSVFAINKSLHKRVHVKIELDLDAKCFLLNGTMIDSKEKHLELIKATAIQFGIYDNIYCIEADNLEEITIHKVQENRIPIRIIPITDKSLSSIPNTLKQTQQLQLAI